MITVTYECSRWPGDPTDVQEYATTAEAAKHVAEQLRAEAADTDWTGYEPTEQQSRLDLAEELERYEFDVALPWSGTLGDPRLTDPVTITIDGTPDVDDRTRQEMLNDELADSLAKG